MNKQQLLVDLAARDGVSGLIGNPVDVTPSGDVGTVKWYSQGLWQQNGKAALKQTQTFYVANEGEANEVAFYKDAEPEFSQVRAAAFKGWMRTAIDAKPNDFKAVQVVWLSERWEMAIYNVLEADGAKGLKWQAYYVRKGVTAPTKISNHDASRLQSVLSL